MSLPESPQSIAPAADESRRRRLTEAVLIAALSLTLNLAGNGRIGLWDRDEPRYAVCTREMRASGDLINPTYNTEPRYHKPVLIYWLMLGGTALGGDNPFGDRLVSALAGAGTCLLIWAFGRRLFGPRVGLLAALIAATAPIMVAEAKLGTIDATLILFFVATQWALWELSQRESLRWVVIFWGTLALGTLAKGPVTPGFLVISAATGWLFGAPLTAWKRLRWRRGLLAFFLITAPWYIAIGISSRGEFYAQAIGYHVLKRMTTPIEQHGHFPGYYVVGTLLTFYPWSALIPAALLGAWARRRSEPALGMLLGWTLGPLVFLECVRTKLLHYYAPSFPACALLAAWLIDALARAEVNLRRWPLGRVALGLLTGIGIGTTVALMAGVLMLPWPLRWPCLVLAGVVGGGTLFGMERFQSGQSIRAAYGLAATWGATLWLTGVWLLPAAEPYRLTGRVASRLDDLARREQATPILSTFQEASVVYALGHPVPIIHSRTDFLDIIHREGTVVSALSEGEINALNREPDLIVEPGETVRGFHITKGRNETLRMTIVRHRQPAVARTPATPSVR